jgi:hypothetical protein
LLLHANRASPSQGSKVHTTAAYLRRPKPIIACKLHQI